MKAWKYFYFIKRQFHKVINYYTLKNNNVLYQKININGIIYVKNNGGTLKIGNNFTANSGINENPIGGDNLLRLVVYKKNAQLLIGENVGISNSTFVCWDKIEIGNNVVIGGGCKIWDTNFHSLDPITRTGVLDIDIKTNPIKICDNVFIGGGVIILKGVEIGKNSVIAAGSVVQKNIPANVIAGGNPCKIIKSI